MGFGDLVSRSGLHEGDIAVCRQPLFGEDVLDRAERGIRDRLELRGKGLLPAWARRTNPGLVGLGLIDRTVGFLRDTAGLDGLQHSDVAYAAMTCIGADRQSHDLLSLGNVGYRNRWPDLQQWERNHETTDKTGNRIQRKWVAKRWDN